MSIKKKLLDWIGKKAFGDYRCSNKDLEELAQDPKYEEEFMKHIQNNLEKGMQIIQFELEAAMNGVSFRHQLEKENQQQTGITHRQLLKLLKNHPEYQVHNAYILKYSPNEQDLFEYNSSIEIRPRDHRLIQLTEIPQAVLKLEEFIGITPFKRSIELCELRNGFSLPKIFYKSSVSKNKSKITQINIGLCDNHHQWPGTIYVLGHPCPYQCQHKEKCSYVHPELLKNPQQMQEGMRKLLER